MLNDSIKAYLEMKAAEYAEPVRKLMTEDIVFFGADSNTVITTSALVIYNEAEEAIMRWLSSVLEMSMSESQSHKEVMVVLHFPCSDMKVVVKGKDWTKDRVFEAEGNSCCEDVCQGYQEKEDYLRTPIGEMNMFTYEAVMQIKDNPVKLLYLHFSSLLAKMHKCRGCESVLNKKCLEDSNVKDNYHIYKMDLLLRDINDFFQGQ